jgi:type II secretory pathway pseudopilin PulG
MPKSLKTYTAASQRRFLRDHLSKQKDKVIINITKSDTRGMALVEAMVATVIFSMVMLGVYACITKAYQLSQVTRYNDQARAVLISYIDQFQRLQTADHVGSADIVRPFFTPSATSGYGLEDLNLLNDTQGDSSAVVTEGDGLPKRITLGEGTSSTQVTAYVTRAVYPVNIATGALLATDSSTSAYYRAPGYGVLGVFTISYTLPSGKSYTQRLTTVRCIP